MEIQSFQLSLPRIFLKHSENKEQLNLFLAQRFFQLNENKSPIFVVTFNDTILTNDLDLVTQTDINYSIAEEADPRLIRHAINQGSNNLKNIVIKTVDTDVLLLAIAYCNRLISFGVKSFLC